jgi:hypothetical protein
MGDTSVKKLFDGRLAGGALCDGANYYITKDGKALSLAVYILRNPANLCTICRPYFRIQNPHKELNYG